MIDDRRSFPPPRKKMNDERDEQSFTERSPKDGAWCWANKSALEKIRTQCEDPRSTLAVYFALCEIASDEQSGYFTASMNRIASKCCLSRRTVFDRLNDLERLYLIRITRSATSENYRIPSSYLLLRCSFQSR